MKNFTHISVLLEELVKSVLPDDNLLLSLNKQKNKEIYIIDCTLGGGGHAAHLIKTFQENQKYKHLFLNLIGIDQDLNALEAAKKKLNNERWQDPRYHIKYLHANFAQLKNILPKSMKNIHGIYADFGVSSPQLDHQERGFSFLKEGPVDMRMNQNDSLTAAKILQTYPETELARIFFEYGEEPKSRILARAIVMDREKQTLPLENTKIFAEYVKKILRYGYSRVHPATRIFQALRIETNAELESIQILLSSIPPLSCPHSKAAFISFHSLEDRLVKRTMRLWQENKLGRENPRGGIIPTAQEIETNPRSRSARLRVFNFLKE